jgi:hypothetical protein
MLTFFRRLRARLRYRRFDDELREELRVHEEMKRQSLEAAGVAAEEAGAAARRALGNVTLMREDARHVWIGPWLDSVAQDARYGVRMLARQPLHSITATAVLVLAISMNTSLFTFLKATSFAPWPAKDPDRTAPLAGQRSRARQLPVRSQPSRPPGLCGRPGAAWSGCGGGDGRARVARVPRRSGRDVARRLTDFASWDSRARPALYQLAMAFELVGVVVRMIATKPSFSPAS